jgi:ABC-type multidrug transport system ATPase subunit
MYLTVPGPKGSKKTILNDVSLSFESGSLTALMGPSGAGKTSLLSVLSQNCNPAHLSGQVLVNESPSPAGLKRISALVPQDDVLLSSLTPRESLSFMARLRLNCSSAERDAKISSVLSSLSLTEHQHTLIGNVEKRGLSGGQRKRVSIALELLINPSILFLDEPTSGLDSKMAEDVTQILQVSAQASEGAGLRVRLRCWRATFGLLGRRGVGGGTSEVSAAKECPSAAEAGRILVLSGRDPPNPPCGWHASEASTPRWPSAG